MGRNGTNGLTASSGQTKILPGGAKTTLTFGMAWTGKTSGVEEVIGAFMLGATEQISVRYAPGQFWRVSRNGTTLATGASSISIGTYYYLEFQATINGATGSYTLKINGTTELSATGVNTAGAGGTTADTFLINAGCSSGIDDLYILDNAGTTNNDFLGDLRVQCIFPDGAGGVTQWTPSAGSNYQNVDETSPNGDTDYNSDATVGDRDTYTYGNLSPSTASIKAIQIIPYARKDDAGTRTIAPVVRIGGVNYDQASLPNLTTSYAYLPQVLETSPATTVAFTLSELNGVEIGAKVVA